MKIEHVSKKFCRSLKRSLWYGIQDIALELTGRQYAHELRPDEFWALRDISLEIRRGESLGLIGPNGAGKSTLLKLLTGLMKLDTGKISVRGRVGALIELGTGFNPILTGLENIYNNAAVLGIPKIEVDKKLESIIEFAEIDEFIHTPVQHYSSGMKVRLGFAVAAHLDPDIMIIDEVLAVGDIGFRAKCLEYISKMMQKTAVIFVSHYMAVVNRYCNRSILLNHGRIISCGEPSVTIDKYYELFEAEQGRVACLPGNQLKNFVLMDAHNHEVEGVAYASTLRIKIEAMLDKRVKNPIFKIIFTNREFQIVADCQSQKGTIVNKNGFVSVTAEISPLLLGPSKYKLSLAIRSEDLKYALIVYEAYWNLRVFGGENDLNVSSIRFLSQWHTP